MFCLSFSIVLPVVNLTPASLAQVNAATESFRQIDQPLGVSVIVTAIAAGLIGLELWWFMMSKPDD